MEEEEGRVERTLTLFDTYWFRHHVLLPPPPPPQPQQQQQPMMTPEVEAVLDIEEDARSNASEPPPISSPGRPIPRRRRSLSDERDFLRSDLRLECARLEAIISGKESAAAEIRGGGAAAAAAGERGGYRRQRSRRRRRSCCTATTAAAAASLTDLEFEELKGLMDLGFTFSEAEAAADPRLVEIVPALRRRSPMSAPAAEVTSPWTAEGSDDAACPPPSTAVARPYLSEAWDAAEEKEEEEKRRYALSHWRIPAVGDEVDLKENLRLWAHTVASTVL